MKTNIEKVFWSLAPLLYGTITWFFSFGPGNKLPIAYSIRQLIILSILAFYFYKPLTIAFQNNRLFFFEYLFSIPNWNIFVLLTGILLTIQSIALFFTWDFGLVFNSFVFGVFASACIEELLTRAFFLKYQMAGMQFLLFNCISSASFTLMHAGFGQLFPSLYDLFITRGHFPWSFAMGIVMYKAQRIEVTMLMHMSSNFFRYTLPTLILHQQIPVIFLLYNCFEILVLGVVHYKNIAQVQESNSS